MTLRRGKPKEIQEMIERMQSESRGLIKTLINLSYFMRGAVQLDSMWWKTYAERKMIQDFLEERFEIEKQRPTPIY